MLENIQNKVKEYGIWKGLRIRELSRTGQVTAESQASSLRDRVLAAKGMTTSEWLSPQRTEGAVSIAASQPSSSSGVWQHSGTAPIGKLSAVSIAAPTPQDKANQLEAFDVEMSTTQAQQLRAGEANEKRTGEVVMRKMSLCNFEIIAKNVEEERYQTNVHTNSFKTTDYMMSKFGENSTGVGRFWRGRPITCYIEGFPPITSFWPTPEGSGHGFDRSAAGVRYSRPGDAPRRHAARTPWYSSLQIPRDATN